MATQIPLMPVSQAELTHAAYQIALLLQQVEEEEAAWTEAKEAHKETMAVLKKGIAEQRQTIRRAQLEHEEGLTQRQVDALLHEATERGEP